MKTRWIAGGLLVLLLGIAGGDYGSGPVSASVFATTPVIVSQDETFQAYTAWLAERHAHAARHGQQSTLVDAF